MFDRSCVSKYADAADSPASTNEIISAVRLQQEMTGREEIFMAYLSKAKQDDEGEPNSQQGKRDHSQVVVEIRAEHSDVFPDDLPARLPPRREVDHRDRAGQHTTKKATLPSLTA